MKPITDNLAYQVIPFACSQGLTSSDEDGIGKKCLFMAKSRVSSVRRCEFESLHARRRTS